jgi:hypothetical protein
VSGSGLIVAILATKDVGKGTNHKNIKRDYGSTTTTVVALADHAKKGESCCCGREPVAAAARSTIETWTLFSTPKKDE